MNTEEIKIQFVTIMTDILDIYEKTSKFTSKDIDALINNVVTLNKKNMLLKKVYDLEEDIGKLKMLITKSTLLSSVEEKEEVEKPSDNDPQQVNEDNEDKEDKKVKLTKKKEEKVKEEAVVKEDTKPKLTKKKEEKVKEEAVVKEDTTPKLTKKKEEKVKEEAVVKEDTKPKVTKNKEEKVDEEAMVKEDTKPKVTKNKEEKVESPKINEVIIEAEVEESNKSDTIIDESHQPLHIKRKKIPKQIKTLVWNEYIGNDIMQNKCLCCKKEKIDIRNFHCGHVIAESKGGDLTIKNLRPICAPCNLSMGAMSMNEFTKTFFGWEV
jgi:hypothetical protein